MQQRRAAWLIGGVVLAVILAGSSFSGGFGGREPLPGALELLARQTGVAPDRFRVDPAAIRAEDGYQGGMRLARYLREEPGRTPRTLEGISRDLTTANGAADRLAFLARLGRSAGEIALPPLVRPRKVVTDTVAASPVEAAMIQLYAGTGKRFQGKDRTRVAREAGSLPEPVAGQLARLLLAVTDAARLRDEVVESSLLEVGGAFNSKSRKTAELLRDFLGRWWDGNAEREHGFRELAPALRSVDLETIERGGVALAAALDQAGDGLAALPAGSIDTVSFQYQWETPIGRVAVGGAGANTYDGSFALVLDLGGDDRYRGAGAVNGRAPVALVLDLGGNDVYEAPDSATVGPGGAILGYAGVVDLGKGDDVWGAPDTTSGGGGWQPGGGVWDLGFGFLGVGWIRDDGGRDRYLGSSLSQGAGLFGLGLLLDEGGDDTYTLTAPPGASAFPVGQGEGFGGPGGVGALVDSGGNDVYLADPGGSTGFPGGAVLGASAGIEPWVAGGMGLVVEREGNDRCDAGGPALGASRDGGLAFFADLAGNDSYTIRGVGGGGYGDRLGTGAFLDLGGDDRILVTGGNEPRALGAGEDLGTGVFVDSAGNDRYDAEGIAFGVSFNEGAGVFADLEGEDVYRGAGTAGMGFVSRAVQGSWRVPAPGVGVFLDLRQSSGAGGERHALPVGDGTMLFAPVRGDGTGLGGALFGLPDAGEGEGKDSSPGDRR